MCGVPLLKIFEISCPRKPERSQAPLHHNVKSLQSSQDLSSVVDLAQKVYKPHEFA